VRRRKRGAEWQQPHSTQQSTWKAPTQHLGLLEVTHEGTHPSLSTTLPNPNPNPNSQPNSQP
jgi:hypothetical protein